MFTTFFIQLLGVCLFVSTATQQTNYKFLGCFSSENKLSLGDECTISNSISPQSCSTYCSTKNFTFFFLKNNTCYCNKNYISSLMQQFDDDCTIKCKGDDSGSCGGKPNFVSSYIADDSKLKNFLRHGGFPIPIYLGCYFETPNDYKNRILKGQNVHYVDNTPQKCSEFCFKMGYLYFGVTNGSECQCGNQQPSKLSKVNDTRCNLTCSGNNKLSCGGDWKMGIYSTGITNHVPRKYVGCFENDEEKVTGKYISYNMGNNNSPKRCMNLCNTQRFKYAAVMDNVCECKNYEPDFNLKRSHSDCNTECIENPSEYCGGGDTLQNIYRTLYLDPPGKVTMKHIGCYRNLNKYPVQSGWKITNNRITPKKCVNSCFARRFLYATLVSSDECLCSSIKPHDTSKAEDGMCTIPCSGSSKHTCGGNSTVDIYSTGLEWRTEEIGYKYEECVEDNRYIRVYDGYFQYFTTNTPEFCSNHCYKLAYQYSGITNNNECFCDIIWPNGIRSPRVNDEQCNTKCIGDANQFCGGVWRMASFSTGINHFGYDESLLECFVPQENTLNDMTFALTQSNRPTLCFRLCNDYGYPFAGIMGTSCLCGNRAPDNGHKVNNTECTKLCVGPWGEICGGEDRIHVYKLKKPIDNSKNSNTRESIILKEEFDSLNKSLWSHDINIPQEPDYEFVFFNTSEENAFVKNGELVIKPTIISDEKFIKEGSLILKKCTNYEDSNACSKKASSFRILPPVISAKLTTKNSLFFNYGELEVVAKLPTGKWIVSELALISKSNEQNKLVLATSLEATVLKYGLKIDERYNLKSNMMESILSKERSNDYHSFVLSRTTENIVIKIDGKGQTLDTRDLPLDVVLDAEYYISISVSAGGMNNFPDSTYFNGHYKPWKDYDPKAMLNFWKEKDRWAPTWDNGRSMLRVKSIKYTKNINID